MKTFILTADYELFLGDRTGTVEKCMLEPTYKLSDILDINNSKMTIFWDILHYSRLLELENKYVKLKEERKLIDEQISFLISKGHDIQLHIHPHWLDAEYKDGEWKFSYTHFNIHLLPEEENPDDINTILGCITISKQLMEKQIKKHLPEYKVTTFRAGGYLIEPFEKLKKAFENNNIFYDSSVLPGMQDSSPSNSYDFINYPKDKFYHFKDSPSESDTDGKFIELPVTTLSIPIFKNLIYALIRFFKYSDLESGRMGTGSGDTNNNSKNSNFAKFISLLTKPKMLALTTDGNFAERFNYMCRKR